MDSIFTLFSIEELGTLYLVPFWVFYEVAGSDSVFDEAEVEAFQSMLDSAPRLRNEIAKELFANMNASFTEVLHRAKTDPKRAYSGLRQAVEIINAKLPADIAAEFKLIVFVMGWHVAAASGDLTETGEGTNISEEEIKNLTAVSEVLGLKRAQLQRVITSSDGDKVWNSFLAS